MKQFIEKAHAYAEALLFFENISKDDLLEMYTELDCVYSLLESQDIVCRYSKNEILKDFDVVEGRAGKKYLRAEGSNRIVDIPINGIINELTRVFSK